MEQVQPASSAETVKINPVQNPQILPISYSLPIWPTRFSSPAASVGISPGLLAMLFSKK